MKITMTEQHLDKALALPWDTKTCLLAQCIADTFKEKINTCGGTSAVTISGIQINAVNTDSQEVCKRVMMFDRYHQQRGHDSAYLIDLISQLRTLLPYTFEANVKRPSVEFEDLDPGDRVGAFRND